MFSFHSQRSRKFVIPYLIVNALEFAFVVVIEIPDLIQKEYISTVVELSVAWGE